MQENQITMSIQLMRKYNKKSTGMRTEYSKFKHATLNQNFKKFTCAFVNTPYNIY